MDDYHISSIPELLFGCGGITDVPELTASYKGPVLLITGKRTLDNIPSVTRLLETLKSRDRLLGVLKIDHEPSPRDIDDAVDGYFEQEVGCVVSIGGGSVMDAGKAISAMLKHSGSIRHYLEGVGDRSPEGDKIPFIAVPTTAGTGSEATQNAVITEKGSKGFKKSLRHINYVPNIAVVDPELTISCSPFTMAASGMDAFSQLVESFLSTQASPFTDTLAFDAIGRIHKFLEVAYEDGQNLEARSEIAYAAYISGITLASSGLGLVHGLAQPLGSLFGIPHGVACGTLMAAANKRSADRLLAEGLTHNPAYQKYVRMGRLFAGSDTRNDAYYIHFCIQEFERLTIALALPSLSAYGINEGHFDTICTHTGLKYHPVKMDKKDINEILRQRL